MVERAVIKIPEDWPVPVPPEMKPASPWVSRRSRCSGVRHAHMHEAVA